MKIIPKYQSGGMYQSIINPFSRLAQSQGSGDGGASSSKSSSKDSDGDNAIIPKEILNKLAENGLSNDVDRFMQMAAQFEVETEQNLKFGLGVDKRKLYALRAEANRIVQLNKRMDKAEEQAVKNEAWDEVAVDQRGYFYVVDESGHMSKVHMSQYDPSTQQALTVGELSERRRYSPETTGDSGIITTIQNSIGLPKINEYIQDILSKVGKSETTTEAYQSLAQIIGSEIARKPTQEELQAIQQMYAYADQVGLDALFKVGDTQSQKNMQIAMEYIMRMLPENMRQQLQGRYIALYGGTYDKSMGYAAQLIQLAAAADNNVEMKHTIDYSAEMNKAAGTKSGASSSSGDKPNKQLKSLEMFIDGSIGQTHLEIVNQEDPTASIEFKGNAMPQLVDFKEEKVGPDLFSEVLKTGIGQLVDTEHIFFGNQKIDKSQLDQIVFEGGQVMKIWVPTTGSGDIDFNQIAQVNKIIEDLQNNTSISIADKNEILLDNNISGYFNQSGQFVGTGNMEEYIVMSGIASGAVGEAKASNNPYSKQVERKDKPAKIREIENIYASHKEKGKGGNPTWEQVNWAPDWDLFTRLFEAPVFIKVSNQARQYVGAMAGKGPEVNNIDYIEQIEHERRNQVQRVTAPTTSDHLK